MLITVAFQRSVAPVLDLIHGWGQEEADAKAGQEGKFTVLFHI